MDPDARLMVLFQKGDRPSFEKLFEKYHRPLLNFCFRILGNPHDAEEITQEVFIQVHQSAERYQPLAKFSTWLYTIARNLCLNRLRSRKQEGIEKPYETGEGEEWPRPQERVRSERPTPEQDLEQKEVAEIVRQAILQLPESLRVPLILRRYQDLSYGEIAEITGVSVTAIKLRLHRAKLSLARQLGPALGPESG